MVASMILVPKTGLLALAGLGALGLFVAVHDVFRGSIDGIICLWAALYPLSYFVEFPHDHPLVTPQRLIVLGAFAALLFVKRSEMAPVPKPLQRTGLICLTFLAVAAFTLQQSPDVLGSARILLDAFLAPVLMGWYVIARFDVRRQIPALHAAVCISSIICAAVAAAEIVTGEDLLRFAGSSMSYAGGIPRPNGPFGSNDALALAGALSLFFLLFLRKSLGPNLSPGRRVLHTIGIAGAIGMALMPMFRSIALTLLLTLIIDTWWERRTTARAWRVAFISSFFALVFTISVFEPKIYQDRSSSDNAYARVAEYKQSLKVFADNPLLGVGFSNFNNYVAGDSRYLETYKGVYSVDWPHSNIAAVLAETGILGFAPYMIMQALLIWAMWRLRRVMPSGQVVWKYFLYMALAYWITGLTETTGYEGFLNLWYAFAATVSYKYVMTDPELMQPAESPVSEEAFSAGAQTFHPAFLR